MSEIDTLCAGCFGYSKPSGPCSHCGVDEEADRSIFFLPLRTELDDKYVIGRDLGSGGFGITYLAWDRNLHVRVAIKEYLPRQLAERDAKTFHVVTTSERERRRFDKGLKAFIEEAQTVERFQHQHIVRVRALFRAHGTAYMVMDYYDGETLDELLRRRDGKIPEAEAIGLLMPILDALREEVHPRQYLHRDISPHNIYLANLDHGVRPVLLDFGAARQALTDSEQELSVVVKPGYAPPEQYDVNGHQGPWTDVFACAATLYRAVTGTVPSFESGSVAPPDQLAFGLTAAVSKAILWGLEAQEHARPQSIAEWQEKLRVGTEIRLEQPLDPPPKEQTPLTVHLPILKILQGELANKEIIVEGAMIIGRDPKLSQLILASSELSHQHCSLRFDAERGRFELQDLRSTNGTYVVVDGQGRRLVPDQPVYLDHGVQFYLFSPDQLFELVIEERSTRPETYHPPTAVSGTVGTTLHRKVPRGCAVVWLVPALAMLLAWLVAVWVLSSAGPSPRSEITWIERSSPVEWSFGGGR